MSKPIMLTHKYKDGTVDSVVWHPSWGAKPDLDKAREEGRLIETDNCYEIVTDDRDKREQ